MIELVIALTGGLIGAIIAYPFGNFAGWQRHRRAVNEHNRRKEAEARRERQEATKKSKRTAYDFTRDETIQFPCVEENR